MIRALFMVTALFALSGCAALVPAAVLTFEAISQIATVTEATCRAGEDLSTANPTALDGHPDLQMAEKVCEALAP